MRKKITNKNHPEKRAGEVYFSNAVDSLLDHPPLCNLKTKRLGIKAFDTFGIPVAHGILKPVFISIEEALSFPPESTEARIIAPWLD